MRNIVCDPILINVTFTENSAAFGGGMQNLGANPTLTNVTFSGNTAGGAIYNGSSNPTIRNSIMYGNTGGEIVDTNSSAPVVTYSIVQGGYAGEGNLDADPMLGALANNGGFTQTMALSAGSPAIDAGTNSGCPATDQRGIARPFGIQCDIGAYEVNSATLTLISTDSQDGWILESTETSGVGGTKNHTASTLNVGDDSANKQYRSVLSFDTTLPANAVITGVTLKFKYAGKSGTLPFGTHGKLLVDVRHVSPFGNNAALQLGDFKSGANKSALFALTNTKVNGWYIVTFDPAQFQYINPAGITQFRLRFTKDDNNDFGADFLKLYSGNAGAASRPRLIVEYYVP